MWLMIDVYNSTTMMGRELQSLEMEMPEILVLAYLWWSLNESCDLVELELNES